MSDELRKRAEAEAITRVRPVQSRDSFDEGYVYGFERGALWHAFYLPSKDVLTRTIAACDPYAAGPDAMHREMAEAVADLLERCEP